MDLKIIKFTKILIFLSIIIFFYIISSSFFIQSYYNFQNFVNINSINKQKLKNLEENNKYELSDDIILLFANDIHCSIMDNIGYDGLSLLKKQLKNQYKTVLTIDCGDAIQGGTIGILSKGFDIIKIMNLIDYDIAILGNHEFDYGLNQLKNISQYLNCGYICANFCFHKNKTSIFPPYKIIEINENDNKKKKIAFIGVITPQTFSKTLIHSIIDEEGKPIYDFLIGNNGKELFETIQKYINELKMKGVNYIIIVAHLGNGGDSLEKYTTDYLISNLYGVDLILDGHSHLVYNTFSEDKYGNLIPIMQTGSNLKNVGIIKIKRDGEILTKIISEIPKPLNINKNNYEYIIKGNKMRWVDLDMKKKLEEIMNQYKDIINEKIGYSNYDMLINNSRSNENILCNFIVDSYKYIGKADISFINAGNVRHNLYKGNITYKTILDILPFFNEIVIKEIKGKDILDALEFGVKNLPNNAQRFPHVSGIIFDVNTNIESTVEVDDNEIFVKVKGKRRVSDVLINGEKLNLEKIYKVSLPYFIANGGDGYSMFNKYNIIINTLTTDIEAVIMYIENYFNGIIPDYYKNKQGRIVIDSKEEFDIFLNHLK